VRRGDRWLGIDDLAAWEQRTNRVPSLVIGATRFAEPRGRAAVGLADVEGHVPADTGLAYRVGSITKTFTAAVVLGLVERGVLALDAPVSTYLSGTTFGQVSVRMLLAHCGGVQRELPGDMWATMLGPDHEGVRAALSEAELVAEPGQRWHYSNLGYAALGLIVGQVAGVGCAELISSRLWAPLGLSSTSWTRLAASAVGYRVDPWADVVHREPDMDQAAVGVAGQSWSTVADLLVWGNALLGGAPEVVSPWVVDMMHTVHVMVDRERWTSAWGLGLILDRRDAFVVAGHTGAMPGFQSALCLDRSSGAVAVVLSNATRGVAIGQLGGDVVEAIAGSPPRAVDEGWQPCEGVPAELEGVLGPWWSESDETVFTWRAGGLHAHLVSAPDAGRTRFARIGPDSYRAVAGRWCGERLRVGRDEQGAVSVLEWASYPFTRAPR